MKKNIVIILIFVVVIGSHSYGQNYFEDFNQPLGEGVYIRIDTTNSYYKELDNGWQVYIEDTFEDYDPDTTFSWFTVLDSTTESYYLRGETSLLGMGSFWLYKSYEVSNNDSLDISVVARTAKNQIKKVF